MRLIQGADDPNDVFRHGALAFEAFVEMTFEIADAHVLHSIGSRHLGFQDATSKTLVVPLRGYLDVVKRLLKVAVGPCRAAVSGPDEVSSERHPRLRHSWPAAESATIEAVIKRKLNVLHAAIMFSNGATNNVAAVNDETTAEEFIK